MKLYLYHPFYLDVNHKDETSFRLATPGLLALDLHNFAMLPNVLTPNSFI